MIVHLPKATPYGFDNYVPVVNIIRWYADSNSAVTRVEVKDLGTVSTGLYPEQVAERYRAAFKEHRL